MATPAFELPIPIRLTNPHHPDDYYGPKEGYIDVGAAIQAIVKEVRYLGMMVGIQSAEGLVEYWWRAGVEEINLVPETTGTGDGEPTTPYSLPVATADTLDGVKVGTGLAIDSTTGILSTTSQEGGSVDITPNVTLNSLKAGTRYQVNVQEFARLATTLFYLPTFPGFTFDGVDSTTREEGTSYAAGAHSFAWGSTNQGNIAANSITIRDVTGNVNLATGLANDGIESISTAGFTVGLGVARRYLISGLDTNGDIFTVEVVISGARAIFFDTLAAVPTTSAQVRAFANSRLTTQGNQFSINTGTANRRFAFWVPTGLSKQLVMDLETNANLTSEYVATPFSVNNAGGIPVAGTLYVMQQAVPFTTNHHHQITVG